MMMTMLSMKCLVWCVLFSVLTGVSGSPLTFALRRNTKECFYTLTPDTDCEISYYFAVQQGDHNDYELSYQVYGPENSHVPIIERTGERQGEWSFIGEQRGEYEFCFDGGRHNDKVVDLEIKYSCVRKSDLDIRREKRKEDKHLRDESMSDQLQESLDDSVDRVERQLSLLERNMEYYKTRNNRNHYTVTSTGHRIVMFSIYGVLLIIGMAMAQILVLKWFFKESRRHQV